ncbi:hypothetical protein PFI31113_00908 [Pandoraea fibrosis]|uniref:4-oxalocrotonate tautomerase-like domain-containing protein n=2 Tax=Pandoraea fibrosis TaxID=1891094 RepID=A0A5E4SMF6_9BURK|nr:hypothetical protein PFI31113_00908 [Pandoraea fibrosis]
MPVVNLKLLKGAFSQENTQKMMDGITDAVAAVAGEYIRRHTIVIVDEVEDGLYSSGGHKVTLKSIEMMRSQSK